MSALLPTHVGRLTKEIADFQDGVTIADILLKHPDIQSIELFGSFVGNRSDESAGIVLITPVELTTKFLCTLSERIRSVSQTSPAILQRMRLDLVIEFLEFRTNGIIQELDSATDHLLGSWKQWLDIVILERDWKRNLSKLAEEYKALGPLFFQMFADGARIYDPQRTVLDPDWS